MFYLSTIDLVFVLFFGDVCTSFAANFGSVAAGLDPYECILVSGNDCISSKISFDSYHPDALLSLFRSQATSLCST